SAPGFTEPGKFFVIDRDTVRSMPSVPGLSGVSPEDVFTAARAAVVGVDDLGSANLAGTSTTHYRVRLDPAKAVQVLGADVPRTRTSAGKTAVDVWLDGSDRIRRISGDLHGTHVDVELSSWGEPVSIEAPPAGDVVQGPIGPMPGGPAVS
ncbi:MAG: lipoprotein LprG, partial [Nocardioidaceae bacterium]|nr:lipoprotein LprG [Nocardioidaceae bacterium]